VQSLLFSNATAATYGLKQHHENIATGVLANAGADAETIVLQMAHLCEGCKCVSFLQAWREVQHGQRSVPADAAVVNVEQPQLAGFNTYAQLVPAGQQDMGQDSRTVCLENGPPANC
jgi:hypothetical protein